ncbi:hypothetical protein ABZ897_10255 [Nonomuraea sp. NPDC046802]|uniref:hypothetical protein n=1 Tax=Nonomuraea sp. NPDC046802 TaxID=3154919 RepID=UPI003403562B
MARQRDRSRPSGIYAAGLQVFRFYPDGVVLDVLVKPSPGPDEGQAVAAWLHRDAPTPLNGVHVARYTLFEGVISFTTRSHFHNGVVDVRGSWSRGRLTLDLRDAGRVQSGLRFVRIWPT